MTYCVSETFNLLEKILSLHVKENRRKRPTAENQNPFVLKQNSQITRTVMSDAL
jgi:hypothetical protein